MLTHNWSRSSETASTAFSIPSHFKGLSPSRTFRIQSPNVRQCAYPETRISVQPFDADKRADRQPGGWIGAHVRSSAAWPTSAYKVVYEGQELEILPRTEEFLPAAFMRTLSITPAKAKETISRFLSAWAWAEDRAIAIENWTQGSHKFRTKRESDFSVIRGDLDFEFLPQSLDRASKLALALYREGMSLGYAPYSFLSYYKVLNVFEKGNSAQRRWIRDNIELIDGHLVQERLRDLGSFPDNQKIEDYIYNAGRLAVAHASASGVYSADPDDPAHEQRLYQDLPIMRALARRVINKEFGVPTSIDVYRSKSKRVEGLIWMLGDELCDEIKKGALVNRRGVPLPSIVHLRNRGKEQYKSLSDLRLRVLKVYDGILDIELSSPDARYLLYIQLDLKEGCLLFDPLGDHVLLDDGTAASADRLAESNEFTAEVLGNGRVQLIEKESNFLVAEAHAYIPENMFLDLDRSRSITERWRQIAQERREK